ncbi:hypothetical protein BDZ91DRAFT_259086 [Kalaharituber pfeilii]|nr:hypothetical protein BDZ91DRAFT_259086 [Kalaharituber pfeilii]
MSNPVDIISCLAIASAQWRRLPLPVYNPAESLPDAWHRFVVATGDLSESVVEDKGLPLTLQLLVEFQYPSSGNWFPSWAQINRWPYHDSSTEMQIGNGDRTSPLHVSRGKLYRRCTIEARGSGGYNVTAVSGRLTSRLQLFGKETIYVHDNYRRNLLLEPKPKDSANHRRRPRFRLKHKCPPREPKEEYVIVALEVDKYEVAYDYVFLVCKEISESVVEEETIIRLRRITTLVGLNGFRTRPNINLDDEQHIKVYLQ